MEERILAAIRQALMDGQLPCPAVHRIASEMGVAPRVVGDVATAAQIRIFRCQMGFFGYGVKAEGKHRIALPAAHVPEEIEAAIRARTVDNQISCFDAWQVAEQFQYPRLAVANILERLDIRVRPCQLGCF